MTYKSVVPPYGLVDLEIPTAQLNVSKYAMFSDQQARKTNRVLLYPSKTNDKVLVAVTQVGSNPNLVKNSLFSDAVSKGEILYDNCRTLSYAGYLNYSQHG